MSIKMKIKVTKEILEKRLTDPGEEVKEYSYWDETFKYIKAIRL